MSEKSPINFTCSTNDWGLSYLCASRAVLMRRAALQSRTGIVFPEVVASRPDLEVDFQELHMDLLAVHCNGCALDFRKLYNSAPEEFVADVIGIKQNINRMTGRLENGYTPKCAKNSKASYQ